MSTFITLSQRTANRTAMYSLFSLLTCINLLAWLWAWLAFHAQPALMGTALLAWVLGLRHALDADHLAAIDNVVRKQVQRGERPLATGLFFSLGHSTIVVAATAVIALLTLSAHRHLHALQTIGQVVGTSISSLFLFLLAAMNLGILHNLWQQVCRLHAQPASQTIQGESLHFDLPGGPLARIFGPVLRLTSKSWHMYFVGFLFGLGFDTASEVALLALSAAQIAHGIGFTQVMALPALFTAGMMLLDTADSVLMTEAYGWAMTQPLRKLWYNLTITAASVLMALLIGSVEIIGLVGERLGLRNQLWKVIAALNNNLTLFGICSLCLFALCWIGSSVLFRRYRSPAV